MSSKKFVRIGLSDGSEEWVFRTGDLGRRHTDGVLEFAGRTDDLVKIRGLRVHLGEVEAALSRDRCVAHCAVIAAADSDAPVDVSLIAYVVPGAGMRIDIDDLRVRLARWLPGFMLPRAILLLDALPRTPNGKLDRSALPRPGREVLGRRSPQVAPRNETEELLGAIWCELLQMDEVGVHDNFFELGGHSLLATRVITHISNQTDIELPILDFFDHPTIADLAVLLEKRRQGPDSAEQTAAGGAVPGPIPGLPRGLESLPLSSAQTRIWFMEQLSAGISAAFNIPRLVYLDGVLEPQVLAESINLIVSRHATLRARFDSDDGLPVQTVAETCVIDLPIVDLSGLDPVMRDTELCRQASDYGARQFDLAAGPLLRCWLFRLEDHRHALLFMLHHIVSDGWSTGIFVRELTTAYSAFAVGRVPDLPELPLQYPDFAAWQRNWLASPAADRQLAYWRRRLAGTLPVLELPADHPRPRLQSLSGAQEPVYIDAGLVAAMERVCREEGATLFMGMLAAFNVLLHRYSGQQDLLVGTPVANRRHASTEGLIGVFVNVLPVRTNIEGKQSFLELLAGVREVSLELLANQDLPFEVLVRELQVQMDLSRSSLFQVAFAMQNMPRAPEIEGIRLTLPKLDNGTSKFDLLLQLYPRDDGTLTGYCEYSTALFEPVTIRRLIGHFEVLLQGLTDTPERPIEQLLPTV